jgi:hypothetical protein
MFHDLFELPFSMMSDLQEPSSLVGGRVDIPLDYKRFLASPSQR